MQEITRLFSLPAVNHSQVKDLENHSTICIPLSTWNPCTPHVKITTGKNYHSPTLYALFFPVVSDIRQGKTVRCQRDETGDLVVITFVFVTFT
mmetsp:Transcript_119148/g.207393  ORF Transcript_119148/g.207393 Transcript_119148/m.207393 type:complete len:93 (+) Transcript_119148:34-312(+)